MVAEVSVNSLNKETVLPPESVGNVHPEGFVNEIVGAVVSGGTVAIHSTREL